MADRAWTQNKVGEWVPAVPLPAFRLGWKQCVCRRWFWTLAGYRGHYAYVHILGMEAADLGGGSL